MYGQVLYFTQKHHKTTETTSRGQSTITGIANQEDEPTTSTLAETAENIGTNVGNVMFSNFVHFSICVSDYRS